MWFGDEPRRSSPDDVLSSPCQTICHPRPGSKVRRAPISAIPPQPYNFVRRRVWPADVIHVNKSTELQFAHYLGEQKPVVADRWVAGFESFQCNGASGSLRRCECRTPCPHRWQELAHAYSLRPATKCG